MTGRWAFWPVLMLLAACSATADSDDDTLKFMQGCWRSSDGEIFEQYAMARSGFLIGALAQGPLDRKPFYELLVFELKDGAWQLTPHPGGARSSVTFALVERGDGRAVFENMAHDFPQRIVYQIDGAGRLETHVAGERDGKAADFQYVSASSPCRADPAPQ